MPAVHLEKDEDLRDWLDKDVPHDAVLLFDCDGVIWTGDSIYPGVKEGLDVLRAHGCRLGFVTNNATSSRSGYESKFHKLGLDWVKKDMIFTSGSASASWIKQNLLPELPKDRRKIYLIGQAGIEEELKEEGLDWAGGTAKEDNVFLPYQDFSAIEHDPSIGVVLHAFDMHFSLVKYARAYNYLKSNPDCRLVLTNADEGFLGGTADKPVRLPGEGRLAAILKDASSHEQTIVGKPSKPLLDIVQNAYSFDPAKTFFFGDNLEIDIPFANRGGLQSVFCLTGVSKEEALKDSPPESHPHFILDSVGDLAQLAGKQ